MPMPDHAAIHPPPSLIDLQRHAAVGAQTSVVKRLGGSAAAADPRLSIGWASEAHGRLATIPASRGMPGPRAAVAVVTALAIAVGDDKEPADVTVH